MFIRKKTFNQLMAEKCQLQQELDKLREDYTDLEANYTEAWGERQEYSDQLDHIRELARNRQRKFREKHKAAK